jgi:hypothetical protein
MVVFRKFLIVLLVCSLVPALPVQAQRRGEARAAVQNFFNLLKMKKYQELYAFLPREMQQRVTREQFVQTLRRLDDFIIVERMEIGRVQQRSSADRSFAVIDTTLYGQLKRPLQLNGQPVEAGKVVVQQYLFSEDGQWKVATADGQTRAQFLKRYPEFSKSFQLTQPQFFLRQNGQWKAFSRK